MFGKIFFLNNPKTITIVLNQCRRLSEGNQKSSGISESFSLRNNAVGNHTVSFNKSGLLAQHRNVIHNKKPYVEYASWIHLTEKYQRKMFGRYGFESGVSPRICFNTNNGKSQKRFGEQFEAEKLVHMINKHKAEESRKNEEILKREEDISKKIDKLDQWKEELYLRIAKKEAEALAAKEKRERLVEEVRRHFGFKVDPRDERFKEVLEQKEKEDKKKQKEAKRRAKEQILLTKIAENSKVQ